MGWKKQALISGASLLFIGAHAIAADPIAKLDRIHRDRVMTTGVEIKKGGQFEVRAVGMTGRFSDDLIASAWILDTKTRKPVWVMERQNSDRKGREGLREVHAKISLDPGKYELYYYAGSYWFENFKIKANDIFEMLGDLFSDNRHSNVDDYLDDFMIALYPPNDNYKDFVIFTPDGDLDDALIKFNKVGDSKYLQQGFTLDKDMPLHIYGLSEYPSGYKEPIDLAWITNSETRERVWKMDRWNTDPAGGGDKNVLVNEDVDFKKGSYILTYVTDDSHAYNEFNVMPPYDPINWGVAILPAKGTEKSAFHLFEPKGREDALVALTRVGDDESLSQGFKLDKDMSLRVLCLGEWSGEFADYGWIENAATGKTVWEITYRNSEPAGGAKKNRMFDGTITLPKGSYIAHYITDDSHSYRDWNDSPPYEQEAWGLALYPGTDFDKSKFHLLDESEIEQSADILVKMTGLGDNVRKRAQFSLKKQTKIHIYAVGEGDSDEMFDFGWIVNDKSGKTVWEMTWRNTEPAGGAKKNRLYDDSIILEPGTYEVNFVTDGSHSFNDWNSAKPRDPSSWGISISIAKETS